MVHVNKPGGRSARARTIAGDLNRFGRTVRDTAQDKLEHLRAGAAGYEHEGRDKLQEVERTLTEYVREQPLTSILIAAGVGLVLGRFWMRR